MTKTIEIKKPPEKDFSQVILPMQGGIVSVTMAYYLKFKGFNVHAISFDWKDFKKSKAIECAKKTCKDLKCMHHIIDMSSLRKVLEGGTATVPGVVNKDNIYLAMCISYAFKYRCPTIFYPIFIPHPQMAHNIGVISETLREIVKISSGRNVHLAYDFQMNELHDIIQLADKLDVPLEKTWSCQRNGRVHCGECAGCLNRKNGFKLAGVKDNVKYRKKSR